MRAGSLFSGVGGLDLGLARAGFEHAFFCESDPWRRGVLAHHWPGVPCYEDVRDMGRGQEPGREPLHASRSDASTRRRRDGLRPVDLLSGGFPCQDVSVAGRRAGLAGSRSGLFHEFARIADALRPRWLLVENVPGLLSSNGGRDFGVVVGTLADVGYGVAWRVLDSRFFGVPQRRRRVFIVGALADTDPRAAAERAGQVLAVGTRCDRHPATRGEAGQDVAGTLGKGAGGRGARGNSIDSAGAYIPVASLSGLGTGGPDDNDGQGGRLVANGLRRSYGKGTDSDATDTMIAAPLSHGSNPNSNMAGRRREDDENLVTAFDWMAGAPDSDNEQSGGKGRKWIARAGDYTGALGKSKYDAVGGISTGVRRLTPTECERLQAWPDGWTNPDGTAPDSRRYAACGDGVTATVSEWIGRRILAASSLPGSAA